ncbi:unnamed protein product [Adineta ricciae]|uniref:Protein-tyrosine-phosphatase n=1 Tax=Adineta ricciae TaxID=249248 RepID=A0A816B9K4_ADIRI|nr:unnamed protein product [Adineta ricciae]
MFNQYIRQSSIPSVNSISKEFESLKCIPIQQENLFNGNFVQYYQYLIMSLFRWKVIQIIIWGLLTIDIILCNNPTSIEISSQTTVMTTTAMTTMTTTTTTTSTTTTSTTTTTTTTKPPDQCINATFSYFSVTNRTSNTFAASIVYNCTFTDNYNFTIIYNEQISNCFIKNDYGNFTGNISVDVECIKIENKAGRNFTFSLNRESVENGSALNASFMVTLQPLPLNSININVTNGTIPASVYMKDCEKIADIKYLVVRCNGSNTSDTPCLKNCTCVCNNLEPGNKYNVSLVRLEIPFVDNHEKSKEEKISLSFTTNLDTATNITREPRDNDTALINFKCPRGSFERIFINCTSYESTCTQDNRPVYKNLTSCSTSTSLPIFPITGNLKYQCKLSTIKEGFTNAVSNSIDIETITKNITFEIPDVSNETVTNITVNPNHDYETIVLVCDVINNPSNVCSRYVRRYNKCSNVVEFRGVRGCDYNCLFTTEKSTYVNMTSNNFNISVFPIEPKITVTNKGSRWILISWKVDENTNIRSFNVIINNSTEISADQTTLSYNLTEGIEPYRSYAISVELISNQNISSETIMTKTSQEAPPSPNSIAVENKLIPQENHPESTDKQYVIDFDPSLFSEDYGPIKKYLVYVRRNESITTTEIYYNGTYEEAKHNESIDYLAAVFIMDSSTRRIQNNISVLLGNETDCSKEVWVCNGPLEPATLYKVIISACTDIGCTNVLSRKFQTHESPKSPGPVLWPLMFVALAFVLAIVAFGVWKRQPLKKYINKNIRKYKGSSEGFRAGSLSLKETYSITPKRPKPLHKYINMTHEDERAIYSEYQELESAAPPYRQADYDPEYAQCDRYANIPARGPWDCSAVRLTADHRLHDYINANEVKGLYSNKQYIACQGPKPNTCEDFWDTILQYSVLKIVMLTRTEERNPHNPSQLLEKCHPYFPGNKGDTLQFGEVTVQTLEVDIRTNADLEIRLILIKSEKSEHRVCHYYFTGWPDFGVVNRQKLLDLLETINSHGHRLISKDKEYNSPMVVHCSAGVGRTGTYIAVDIITGLINQAVSDGKLSSMILDVMGVISRLREDRCKMVQTKDQYMLVNRCVEEYLKRINRLKDVLQDSNIYESPTYDSVATPDSIYINERSISRQLSSSSVYAKERSSHDRSRSNVVQRQSKYDGYYNQINDDRTPPVPDRDSHRRDANKM